jgi:hypothetical protein
MNVLLRSLLGAVLLQFAILPHAAAQVRRETPFFGWRTFTVPEYGTTIEYPAAVFVQAGAPEKGVGERFKSTDGRAILSVYARDNDSGDTPASYVRRNLRIDRSTLDYDRIARSFFAISTEREGLIYYSRCNFSSSAGAVIHCFDLVYPQEEKRSWDAVVTRMSLSLRP